MGISEKKWTIFPCAACEVLFHGFCEILWAELSSFPNKISIKRVALYRALLYNSLEHIRRAEAISLFFPLPPLLSPASSIFRPIESFCSNFSLLFWHYRAKTFLFYGLWSILNWKLKGIVWESTNRPNCRFLWKQNGAYTGSISISPVLVCGRELT